MARGVERLDRDIAAGGAEPRRVQTPAVFSFIGATPRTDWLAGEIERDSKGFVRTGAGLAKSPEWKAARAPYLLETSHPGVFAAGDVRSGSVKRVAAAVGEGAQVVSALHAYLARSGSAATSAAEIARA